MYADSGDCTAAWTGRPGIAGSHRSGQPEADVGASSVVLAAGTAYTVFLGVGKQGLTVLYVLCSTIL